MFSERVIGLLRALQRPGPVQAGALAKALGVHERTVRRDIARLEAMGLSVRRKRGCAGGYRMDRAAGMAGTVGSEASPVEEGSPIVAVFEVEEAVAVVAGLRRLKAPDAREGWGVRDAQRFSVRARRSETQVRGDARRASAKLVQMMEPAGRVRVRQLGLALDGAERAANLRSLATYTLRRR